RGSTTLNFSGATSVTVTGTSGNDVLNYNGTISAPIALNTGAGSDTLNILAGTYTLNSDVNAGAASVSINVSSFASAVFNSAQHIAGLSVAGSGTVTANGSLTTTDNVSNAGTINLNAS